MRYLISQFFILWSKEDRKLWNALYTMLGAKPGNLKLYKLACQHRSVQNGESSNERLEFLGDAVLSLIIGEYLFKKYPYKEEGFLTEIRSKIVSREALNKLAQKIGLKELVQYNQRSRTSKSVYGDAMEALINHCCGVETNRKTTDSNQN